MLSLPPLRARRVVNPRSGGLQQPHSPHGKHGRSVPALGESHPVLPWTRGDAPCLVPQPRMDAHPLPAPADRCEPLHEPPSPRRAEAPQPHVLSRGL